MTASTTPVRELAYLPPIRLWGCRFFTVLVFNRPRLGVVRDWWSVDVNLLWVSAVLYWTRHTPKSKRLRRFYAL